MVSNTSGSTMRISLDPWGVLAPEQLLQKQAVAATATAGYREGAGSTDNGLSVMLEFVYLKSWDRMGQAELQCQGETDDTAFRRNSVSSLHQNVLSV